MSQWVSTYHKSLLPLTRFTWFEKRQFQLCKRLLTDFSHMDQGENAKTVREVVNMDIFAVEGDKWVSVIVNLLIMQASLLIASCCLAAQHCREHFTSSFISSICSWNKDWFQNSIKKNNQNTKFRNDFRLMNSDTISLFYRAEVRRSFITTTVREESQVTPQGRHR